MTDKARPPRFAISVPVGAWHPFLPSALSSLAAQDVPLSVAFMDASGDPRVRAEADRFADLFAYRRHGPDEGQSAAIAEGWAHAEGDVLGWLNADDMLFPGALTKAGARFASDESIGAVCGHSTILDGKGATRGYQWSVEPPSDLLRRSAIISQPSCFFTRAAFEAAGGLNLDLHYTMDWDLFLRLYESGARFDFEDEALSMILWEEGTKTSTFAGRRKQEIKRIARLYAPAGQGSKIIRAFAINHAIETMPGPLGALVMRLLVRGGKVIAGLSADGSVAKEARLPLAHYEAEAKETLVISSPEPAMLGAVAVDGVPVTFSPVNGGHSARLPMPIPAGRPVNVTLTAAQQGPFRLGALLLAP